MRHCIALGLLLIAGSTLRAQTNMGACTAERSSLQAILAVAENARLPLGLVLRDKELCNTPCSLGDTAAGPQDSIRELLTGSSYTLQPSGLAWVIAPKVGDEFQSKVLHQGIGGTFSSRAAISALGIQLEGWIEMFLHPGQGWAASILGNSDEEEVEVTEGPQNTFKEVLNAIVSKGGNGLWLMTARSQPAVPQDGEGQLPPLVQTYSYTYNKSALASISCKQQELPIDAAKP